MIKNPATTVVLGLLFVSLVVLYLFVPQNPLVTFLSIIIMAISVIVAITGGGSEIAVMTAYSALVSLVAAYFVGQARFGNTGGTLIALVWGGVLVLTFQWVMRNIVAVPKDRAIVSSRTYVGTLHFRPPLIPILERRFASIPLYELTEDVKVEKINTQAGHNIDMIEVHVHYKVVNPRLVLTGLPNRGQTESLVAKEMGVDRTRARADVAFWEKVLGRQMRSEVIDIVRDVVFPDTANAVEAYNRRSALGDEVRQRINALVNRWGVQVTKVELDHFDVAEERFRAANMEKVIERETRMKEIEAQREATRIRLTKAAMAEAEADRVTRLVQSLKESGVQLSPEDLEEIVISAIRASSDLDLENNLLRYSPEPAPQARPGAPKGSNGSKK